MVWRADRYNIILTKRSNHTFELHIFKKTGTTWVTDDICLHKSQYQKPEKE